MCLIILVSNIFASITIHGYVYNTNEVPIIGAQVYASATGPNETVIEETVYTDESGYFTITTQPAQFSFAVFKSGYLTYYSEEYSNYLVDNEVYSQNFFMNPTAAPTYPPNSLLPGDGAINVLTNTTLSWDYNALNTASIKLFISQSTAFGDPIYNGVPINSHNVNNLENGKTYYWKVTGVNSTGTEWDSNVQTFTTEGSIAIASLNRSTFFSNFVGFNKATEYKANRYILSGEFRTATNGIDLGLTIVNSNNMNPLYEYGFGSVRDDLNAYFLLKSDGNIYVGGTLDKQASYNNKPFAVNKILFNQSQNNCSNVWNGSKEFYVESSYINYCYGMVNGDYGNVMLAGWDGDNISILNITPNGDMQNQGKIRANNGNDEVSPNKIVQGDGNIFVVGTYQSKSPNPVTSYPYLVKINPIDGSKLFDRKYVTEPFSNYGTIRDLYYYENHLYITGSYFSGYSTDSYVACLTASGDLEWFKPISTGATDQGISINVSSTKIHVVTNTNINGTNDIWISTFSLSGNLLCQQIYTSENNDYPSGAFINAWGSLVVYGYEQNSSTYYKRAFTKEFANIDTARPTIPVLVGPIDGTDHISVFANLKWQDTCPNPISGFRMYFGTDNPPSNLINGQILNYGTSNFNSPILQPNTRYYWRAIPFNGVNETPYDMPVWTFMTEAAATGNTQIDPAVSLGLPAEINPNAINNVDASIQISTDNIQQPADITINLGTIAPESIPNPENALNLWMQFISSINIYPVTIEVIFDGIEFLGSIPEIIVNYGDYWTSMGLSDIQLLGTNPYHIRFTYNPPTRSVSAYFAFSSGDSSTLPVTLSSFNAVNMQNNQINILWSTESETNLSGYHIFRAENDTYENAIRISSQIIQPNNCCSTSNYSFIDSEIENNKTYYYWLSSFEMNGSNNLYGPVSVKITEQPETPVLIKDFELSQNYPNPFNPSTTIRYSIAGLIGESVDTDISIFNVKGQKIKTLYSGLHQSGKDFTVKWDGKNEQGISCASGIYFYQIKTPAFTDMKKMIMIK
jgi:hypothetical protein